MSEQLIYIWGRLVCRVFGIETVSCRGRKACSVKHGHERGDR